ncbi:MAG: AAA family ATPase [Nitrospirales bacterium]|nr:AAA family ATPase [Nitrospirales bacterium]
MTVSLKGLAHPIPTDFFVEQSIHWAILKFRQGEPATLLNGAEYVRPADVVRPLVCEGLPAVMYANGGSGKSYIGLFTCLLVETRQSIGTLCVPKSRNALYLDWEFDAGVQVYRKQQILKGHPNLRCAGPLYRRMYRPLIDEIQTIHKLVQEHDIGFLCVDSLAPATGGDQMGAEGAIRFFEALRALNVGSLTLAHSPKSAEIKTIFGTAFNYNLARSVWEIQTSQEEASDEIRLGFYHRKNNLGRLHASFGLKLTFPPEDQELSHGVRFSHYDLNEDAVLSQSLPLRKRIVHVLGSGALSVNELTELLAVDKAKIRARLHEGKGKYFILFSGTGQDAKWGLVQR